MRATTTPRIEPAIVFSYVRRLFIARMAGTRKVNMNVLHPAYKPQMKSNQPKLLLKKNLRRGDSIDGVSSDICRVTNVMLPSMMKKIIASEFRVTINK